MSTTTAPSAERAAPVPELTALSDPTALLALLSELFEPSPVLKDKLVPEVSARLAQGSPQTYGAVVDTCAATVDSWPREDRAAFVSGHPLIGEVKLAGHSAVEQAHGGATRPVVLDRLAHLNALYAHSFPGLRFITFVNGRPRAEIVREMEDVLGIPPTPLPLPDDYDVSDPALDSPAAAQLVRDPTSPAWAEECARCVDAVWDIARSRLRGMGLE